MDKFRQCAFGDVKACDDKCEFFRTCTRNPKNRTGREEKRMCKLYVSYKLDEGAKMPTKAHKEDAGFDLYTPHEVTVKAGESATVHTGTHMILPSGWCGLLVSKSGLNTKRDIQTTGLVDAGYNGEIVVKVQNHGKEDYHFEAGEKVSQIVILPVCDVELVEELDELPFSERGDNGFGSSGRF